VPEVQIPQELKDVFDKRGSDWTPREKKAVLNWIYKTQQKYLLVFAVQHLGKHGKFQEAEDVFQDFFAKKFNGVIKNYNPAWKNDAPTQETSNLFWSYLIRSFRNLCYERRRELIERYHKEPLIEQPETEGDQPIDNLVPLEEPRNPLDELEEQEKQEEEKRLLQRLAKEHPTYYEVLVLFHFREMSHKAISLKLGITEVNSRARLCRAHQELRRYLEESQENPL
jgi:RNA polymerase sigma factor (sigma-70 family)